MIGFLATGYNTRLILGADLLLLLDCLGRNSHAWDSWVVELLSDLLSLFFIDFLLKLLE